MWVERAGADGVFLDGTPWGGAYYPDPSNLRDYESRAEIEAATRAFVDNLRTVTMVIDDEWKDGRQEHLDGLWDEGWMGYDSTIPTWGFDSPARWETAVATVEQVSARKKLDLSQGWYHHGNRFELEYLIASYLLGKRSNSALFQPCPIDSPHLPEGSPYDLSCYAADVYAAELEAYPEIFDVELGPPMGVRYPVEEHLWAREFQRGRVYVNASLTESRVVDLGETMQNVDDGAVDGLTLPPRTGAILRRAGGTAVTEVGAVTPRQSRLEPNHPNPFNARTILPYAVGREGFVEFTVYDLQGQLVRRLVSGERSPGFYKTVWDGTNAGGEAVASGVYVSRLLVGSSFRQRPQDDADAVGGGELPAWIPGFRQSNAKGLDNRLWRCGEIYPGRRTGIPAEVAGHSPRFRIPRHSGARQNAEFNPKEQSGHRMNHNWLNRPGILLLLAFHAVLLQADPGASQQTEGEAVPASSEMDSRKVLDIQATNAFTRAAGALHDMLQAAGHSEWSPARLQGVLGNAFSYETRKGAARVWQEASLDWWLFLQILPELDLGCRIKRFQVRHQEDALWSPGGPGSGFRPRHQDKSQALKAAAWEAVRESIDRGIPAVAWNPMSFEQAEAGLSARDWGLLVGYDLSDETYTVRHNYVRDDFTVRYDEIGHTEPSELFCVLVYDGPKPGDLTRVHIEGPEKRRRLRERNPLRSGGIHLFRGRARLRSYRVVGGSSRIRGRRPGAGPLPDLGADGTSGICRRVPP